MAYRESSKETTRARDKWGHAVERTFTTYKCGFCGGYCVTGEGQQPPAKCGKCHL